MAAAEPVDPADSPGRLSDRVYARLRAQIEGGDYAHDDRLPGEIELTRRFGVSRPVLRQALARLRSEGLLRSRQGAGNFVSARPASGALEFGPLRNIPDVQRCLDFRCGIESEAASRAAVNRDERNLKDMARAIKTMEQAFAAGEPAIAADFAFHFEIARATGNRFFLITLEALRPQILFSINLVRTLATRPLADRAAEIVAEHRRIHEAIRSGDPQQARAAVSTHLGNGVRRLFGD